MHYYVYAALIFANGQIRDARNITYSSSKPATIIDFRRDVADYYAGPPDSYSGIIISHWQEIDEHTHKMIVEEYKRLTEEAMMRMQEQNRL